MKISEVALNDFWRNPYNSTIYHEARMNISPFLSISHSCDEVLQWATEQLSQAGLRPVPTFDLHTARLALHDCLCPNHGTKECDCQMVVVLVYGKAEDSSTPFNTGPVTLILHGNDGQTWVSILEGPQQGSDTQLSTEIKHALEVKAPEPNTP
jgi:hypothetical protein